MIEAAGEHEEVVRDMIKRLFPASLRHIERSNYGSDWKNRWLRERRVAHQNVLRFYLERVTSYELQTFMEAENIWMRMTDQNDLEVYLNLLPTERIQDVISSLEAYEDQFSPEHVVPSSVVLLNLSPNLPERNHGMFDIDASSVIRRVVYRLMRVLKDPQTVEVAVQEILSQVPSLSSKWELI